MIDLRRGGHTGRVDPKYALLDRLNKEIIGQQIYLEISNNGIGRKRTFDLKILYHQINGQTSFKSSNPQKMVLLVK